jgi:hypothetical protein
MKLLTKELAAKLLENGREQGRVKGTKAERDFFPVVKFFYPAGAATWLITEADPEEPDVLFGLCDLGHGSPELGSVRLSELQSFRGRCGLGIERDRFFEARAPLSRYADAAYEAGHIVEQIEPAAAPGMAASFNPSKGENHG